MLNIEGNNPVKAKLSILNVRQLTSLEKFMGENFVSTHTKSGRLFITTYQLCYS